MNLRDEQIFVKTPPSRSSTPPPGAAAQDGFGETRIGHSSPRSPALSTASTFDGEDEINSSPPLPPLPAPSLPNRAVELLRSPSPSRNSQDDSNFGTASWGSPYPRTDRNLRRQSFSSEPSDDSPIHHLAIDTPFLRPAPEREQAETEPQSSLSAAAAVLANRVRRQTRGLTEDWIRTHTTGDFNTEPRHWFSDGSDSEHSSLSGSEKDWFEESNPQTPKALRDIKQASQRLSRHPKGASSIDTLRPKHSVSLKKGVLSKMASETADLAPSALAVDPSREADLLDAPASASTADGEIDAFDKALQSSNGEAKPPTTPIRATQKPLPKEPVMTPRIKKKVPWKGKNIMVLLPRDDQRGLPGQAPRPLKQTDIERMFDAWEELGYSVDGFDLLVEGYQPPGTSDSQSRLDWPTTEEIAAERSQRKYQVTLPDLNAWRDYVNELQEAKLRALGVSLAEEEPEPSVSPPTEPSRQPSAQYPPLPFSPPVPTSSASSNQAIAGYPFPQQFAGATSQSPIPFAAAQGKFNPRQSISLSGANSPFPFAQTPPGWPAQAGMLPRNDSPSLVNLSGMMSPQSPFGIEAFNQMNQGLQYPLLPHQQLQQQQQQQQSARASPRLQEVHEDEEDESKSPSKTPEPAKQNPEGLQAEIDDAEYHLEEQLRNQLEHEDYNPETQKPTGETLAQAHERQASGNLAVSERFANEPGKPLVLHHPRPHSRGHSLSQNYFQEQVEAQNDVEESNFRSQFPDAKADEAQEIETNPSNLGTPVQENFDFTGAFAHQKTDSAASNPWNNSSSLNGRTSRRSSHGSKPSLSKLNVQAPEFKFNPTSSFTPGLFNFSGSESQPTAFQASVQGLPPSDSASSIPQFGSPQFGTNTSSFSLGNTDFSFSSDGPKFRPDAPAFMPTFQSLSDSVTSAGTSVNGHGSNRGSIFGSIDLNTSDIIKPAKKSKAIPIVRPSSRSSAKATKLSPHDDETLDPADDGRVADDSRIKRARSAAPDGDDVPLFAEQPSEDTPIERGIVDEDAEGELVAPADTSMSSMASPDLIDTKATTAAPSETSPPSQGLRNDAVFDFGSKLANQTPTQKGHRKSLSATAPAFQPRASLSGKDELPTIVPAEEPSPVESPVPSQPVSPIAASAPSSPSPPAPRQGLGLSRFASPPPKPKGLAASRFAAAEPEPEPVVEQTPTPQPEVSEILESVEHVEAVEDAPSAAESESTPPVSAIEKIKQVQNGELSFEEIDAVMEHLEHDPSKGVKKTAGPLDLPEPLEPTYPELEREPSPEEALPEPVSPPPPRHRDLPPVTTQPLINTELEDPFVDPPSARFPEHTTDLQELEPQNAVLSDWEAAFSEDEHEKLENRTQFFDGRVNDIVDNLLASRLQPLEKALFSIQDALASQRRRGVSSRRDVRSLSAELQESDADDEDDEPLPRRSLSPRKDRKMEHIRLAVTEALAAHLPTQPEAAPVVSDAVHVDDTAVLKAIEEMRQHFSTTMKPEDRSEDLKAIIEAAVQSRIPAAPQPDMDIIEKMDQLQAKVIDLEERLYAEQAKVEKEVADRRAADDVSAELNRKLQAAETRVEVEIINRSVFDQRVADLEDKLRHHEAQAEEQVQLRRAAEDRLSEVQRLLRISSEEENRLREVVEEREQKIKDIEQASGKTSMRMALLEAAQNNSSQSESEMANKVNMLEADLRTVRQDNNHWRAEAEHADESARRKSGELAHVLEENKHVLKSLTTMTSQLEENERLRESWRAKFLSLQEDMGKAAREVAEENARRIKKDQAMQARHEVLDARLQAEAKTRERLEVEMERLQMNERQGMRATNECKRLEGLLGELRTENHQLQQQASQYQREFEEAREIGASEVKRTRLALQTELDAANHQVNAVREELEEQNSKLRAELDNFKLEADTAKARNEMMLEEAETIKATELEETKRKHQNELEDVTAKYERQLNNATEDGQKTEQHLLERLSLSSSKIEHLQDRIVHLEDKVEIAKQAAAAAAQAAKSAGVEPGPGAAALTREKPAARKLDLPEKISPQALRESIMVLQEQLQAREQRIEELEQIVAKSDPDAASKISKRDDEITWLRELLGVRHGDLQDIIAALSSESFDRNRVKDAAIRLKANLQMEQQERERAMHGGSAISLPNIAQSLQAASPRVAQTIGAAWGNWRKASQPSMRSMSGALNSPSAAHNATPSRSNSGPPNNLLGGLMTPPASGLRQTPPGDNRPQPTAFSATGRRYPSQGSSSNRARGASNTSRTAEKMPATQETMTHHEEREEPQTPPMTGSNSYDSDAQLGDFDEHDFFDED